VINLSEVVIGDLLVAFLPLNMRMSRTLHLTLIHDTSKVGIMREHLIQD